MLDYRIVPDDFSWILAVWAEKKVKYISVNRQIPLNICLKVMFLSRALVVLDLQTRNAAWTYACIKIIIFNMQNQKDNLCVKLEMTNFYRFPLPPMFQDYCTAAPMKNSHLIPNIAEGKCCTRFLSFFSLWIFC